MPNSLPSEQLYIYIYKISKIENKDIVCLKLKITKEINKTLIFMVETLKNNFFLMFHSLERLKNRTCVYVYNNIIFIFKE